MKTNDGSFAVAPSARRSQWLKKKIAEYEEVVTGVRRPKRAKKRRRRVRVVLAPRLRRERERKRRVRYAPPVPMTDEELARLRPPRPMAAQAAQVVGRLKQSY